LFFRRKKRVKVKIYSHNDNGFLAYATDGQMYFWNCFGSTKESAKEMALFKLRKEQEKDRNVGKGV
jgi:hypothetical protein